MTYTRQRTASLKDLTANVSAARRRTDQKVMTPGGERYIYERGDGSRFYKLGGHELPYNSPENRHKRWDALVQTASFAAKTHRTIETEVLDPVRGLYRMRYVGYRPSDWFTAQVVGPPPPQ